MRLKRLSLHGYKTFATKTDFEFGEGITAIVGPNGCGKSNIADAIRWVLGEQSYSTLRGRRTTDMIFAGSRSRARAGMAQAVLTLDNAEGWLSIDYSEIEIGRRAYRSGENEYILNQQKVRLRDVNELIANSGLGARTYTIIGQGLVDQALSLRAEERRALFEEAAGITHYKLKRAETIRHLDETKRNLERVYDIIAEIEPRLRSLRQQASRALNYEHVAADLQQHLRIWFGFHWEKARADLRAAKDESNLAQEMWDQGRLDHIDQQKRIDETREQVNLLLESLQVKQEARESIRTKLETANRDAAILAERLDFTQRRLNEIQEDIPRLERQRAQAQGELDKAIIEFEKASGAIDLDMKALRSFEQRVEAQDSAIEKWELEIADLNTSVIRSRDQMNKASGSLDQLRERLSALQKDRLSPDDLEIFQKKVHSSSRSVEALRDSVGQRRSELNEVQLEIEAKEERGQELRRQLKTSAEERQQLNLEVAKLDSRLQLLEKIDTPDDVDLSEYSSSIGYLDELISIDTDHEIAIRSALSESIKTLVLSSEEDLWDVVSKLPPNRYVANYHSIQKQESLQRHDSPHLIGPASAFVRSETPINNLIDLLLGRIFLVSGSHLEAMEIARELPPGYSVVTTDGLLILAGGLIKSPSIAGEELLKRRLEVKEIKDQIEISAGLLRKNSEDSEMFEAHSRELAAEIQLLREGYEEKLAELRGVERSLFENEHSLAASEKELKAAVRGQEILEEEITALEERINVVEVRIEANKEQTERLESSIELAEVELRALPASEIADERRHLQQNIETTKTIVAGRQAVVDSRRATLVQIDEQLDRIGQRIEDLRSREVDLELAEKQAEANNHQKTMEDIDAELKPLQMSLKERRDEITVMEKKLSEQLMKNQAAEKRYVQARVALNQADNRIEGLKERISADLGLVALRYDEDEIAQSPLPMKDVVDQLPAVEELPQDIEKTIQRLRGQLHRMGGINPDAPAEYDETRKRHDFLKQQVVDLTATIEQLQGVIVELDELTSKVFVETVQKVDENFGEVFRRLFGGGTGRLVLTDPDDLITTGVDIVARLPNRREQALGLLSGGERSLTATALIFSLLMVSPTPFCVLDEVDAMLDEANVNRFREMLQELSEETQFIIITHNRGTVQVAESVYGVSMGADSASQVISIKPEEYVTFSGVR